MGTNYYIMNKQDYELDRKLYNLINNKNIDDLTIKLKDLILEEYKDVINVLNENKLDSIIEALKDKFDDIISNIESDLKYGLDYYVDIEEARRLHIGKSSWGWLFNFQDQNEWHSYEQFKNYILDPKNMEGKIIYSESSEIFTPEEMLKIIDDKQNDERNHQNPDNFKYSKNINGYRFSYGDFS